jgi:hypothetical protein
VFVRQIRPDDWIVTQRWLWTRRERHLNPGSLPLPTIAGEDDDGGKRYRCLLMTPDGSICFSEHRKKEAAKLALDSMVELIGAVRPSESKT